MFGGRRPSMREEYCAPSKAGSAQLPLTSARPYRPTDTFARASDFQSRLLVRERLDRGDRQGLGPMQWRTGEGATTQPRPGRPPARTPSSRGPVQPIRRTPKDFCLYSPNKALPQHAARRRVASPCIST